MFNMNEIFCFAIIFIAMPLQTGSVFVHRAEISVQKNRTLFVTSDKFLGLGIDSNLIRHHWEKFDFNSKRLMTLASGLSPAHLRLSGTDGDRMIFECPQDVQHTERDVNSLKLNDIPPTLFPPTNFTFSTNSWDNINRFSKEAGWRIMFGLNAELRQRTSLWTTKWDPTNALCLLRYSIEKGYADNLDFELGNEPDLYMFQKLWPVSSKQLAKDYRLLKTIIKDELKPAFESSKLYGPALADTTSVLSPLSHWFLKGFLENTDDEIEAITWHHYYGGAELKFVENYTDPSILDTYARECDNIMSIVKGSKHSGIKVWQGETSSTYAPPGSNIDESYVAGFMLLDKLGVSARCGMDVVIRQTFFGFWFALVDQNIDPTPNYWVALLFRQLVGPKVLAVDINLHRDAGCASYLRSYAHCVSESNKDYYKPGAVVLYTLNLLESELYLDLSKTGSKIYEFLFTPDNWDLVSKTVKLNGKILDLQSDSHLPQLDGRPIRDPSNMYLPSKTFAFYVVEDANAGVCHRM